MNNPKKKLSLGVIRETKDPPDKRVPLPPVQCRRLVDRYEQLDIVVQPSDNRCFSDDEYREAGIPLQEDLSGCDVMMGVKEVRTDSLIAGKTYLFFSHTAKEQPYNRGLLEAVVRKGIRLVDYEYLTDTNQVRVVAFGRWAGVVGAYNGIRAFGLRSDRFDLKPAHACYDLNELKAELNRADPGTTRICVTGGGRVAGGATGVLDAAGILQVEPEAFLEKTYKHPVYTRLDPWHYTRRNDGSAFDFGHFMTHPEMYENAFLPYAMQTNLFMACHFWDPRAPVMLTRRDLAGGKVPISIIADISCDIDGPIASTIRASTIAEPLYGYDPETGKETGPFDTGSITVMAVDNLPGELPRDASEDFGAALVEQVIPELLGIKDTGMLDRASITMDGKLTDRYSYLTDFLEGRS